MVIRTKHNNWFTRRKFYNLHKQINRMKPIAFPASVFSVLLKTFHIVSVTPLPLSIYLCLLVIKKKKLFYQLRKHTVGLMNVGNTFNVFQFDVFVCVYTLFALGIQSIQLQKKNSIEMYAAKTFIPVLFTCIPYIYSFWPFSRSDEMCVMREKPISIVIIDTHRYRIVYWTFFDST